MTARSPALHVTGDTPPSFIVAAFDDGLVHIDNSLLWIDACRRAKVSVEAHLFAEGGHGFGLHLPKDQSGLAAGPICSLCGCASTADEGFHSRGQLALAECELTHLPRAPIDAAKAAAQHAAYERALEHAGFEIVRLPDLPTIPMRCSSRTLRCCWMRMR